MKSLYDRIRWKIHSYIVCGSMPQTGWQTTYVASRTHKHIKASSCIHKHTHAICGAHTITSSGRRENGVGRGERDWVGGGGRKRWRKRQRESRSERHMAFSLKKDEQRETKTRIWISLIRKRRGCEGEGRRRKCRCVCICTENGAHKCPLKYEYWMSVCG